MEPPFISDLHALFVGWVLGTALRHGVPLVPITDAAGNYTDRLALTLPDAPFSITLVLPPPPADWTFPDA